MTCYTKVQLLKKLANEYVMIVPIQYYDDDDEGR